MRNEVSEYWSDSGGMTSAFVSDPQMRSAISMESASLDSEPFLMTSLSMTISSDVMLSGQFC